MSRKAGETDLAAQGRGATVFPISLPIFSLILLIILAVRMWGACRPFGNLDNITIPDDAFLSLTVARNLAHGMGIWYGLAPTNGFQPLYVVLSSVFYLFNTDSLFAPLRGALYLLVAADVATLAILLRWAGQHMRGAAGLLLIAALWITNGYILSNTLNGLETMLALALAAGCMAWFDRLLGQMLSPTFDELMVLGVIFGLGALARIDVLLLGPLMGAIYIWRESRRKRLREALRTGRGAVLGFGLVYLPWQFYQHGQTGDWFPVSGRAVRQLMILRAMPPMTWPQFLATKFKIAGLTILTFDQVFLLTIAGLGVACLVLHAVSRKRAQKPIAQTSDPIRMSGIRLWGLPLAFALMLIFAYAGFIYAHWYFNRYLLPVVLPLLLAAGWLMNKAMARTPQKWRRGAALAIIGAAVFVEGNSDYLRLILGAHPENTGGYYQEMGAWVRKNIPPGTRVGSTQSGALGYFGEQLTVINLDGMVNRAAFDAIRQRGLMDYIRREKIAYLVDWAPQQWLLQRGSRNFSATDLEEVASIPKSRPWEQTWRLYRVKPAP